MGTAQLAEANTETLKEHTEFIWHSEPPRVTRRPNPVGG